MWIDVGCVHNAGRQREDGSDLNRSETLACQRTIPTPQSLPTNSFVTRCDVSARTRRSAFAAGRPVFVIKGTMIVALHPDGTEEVVESLRPQLETASDPQ